MHKCSLAKPQLFVSKVTAQKEVLVTNPSFTRFVFSAGQSLTGVVKVIYLSHNLILNPDTVRISFDSHAEVKDHFKIAQNVMTVLDTQYICISTNLWQY